MEEVKDVRRPAYHGVKGEGYFNKSPEASAFMKRINDKAREPFTTRQGQATMIDVTAPGYHDAMMDAWKSVQPDLSQDVPSSLWTMPYEDRERLVATVRNSGIKSMEAFDELAGQAATFGAESLKRGQGDAVALGKDAFADAFRFFGECGELDPEDGKTATDPLGELRDTGRYVTLEGPDGSVSHYMMEMRPLNETHRFLDLECPEGEAQVLMINEGDYKVHGVWGSSPLIQAGIEAARGHMAEHGTIYPKGCGSFGREVERIAGPAPQIARMNAAMAETDAREAEGPAIDDGIEK